MDEQKRLMKQQLNLSIPSGLDYIIATLISMVDIFAISRLGSKVVAAVGAMTSLIFFYNLIIKSIQVSNNVLIARKIGKGNKSEKSIYTGNAVLLTAFFQMICILIIILFSRFIPALFKVDSICLTYLYIRLVGSIPFAITFIITGHERTNGKSKQMLHVRILSLLLNIILDYIAIKLDYGIIGVAWATVIIEIINMILVIISAKDTICYKYNKNAISEIVSLAKHGIMDRFFERGGKLFLDIILSRLGTFEYAAHVVLNQIEAFANDFCYGFCIGITTNIGIEIGKEKKNNLLNLRNIINKIMITLTILTPIIVCMLSIILLPILLKETEVLQISYKLLPFIVIYTIIMPIKFKYSSIIEGMKEFKFNAQVSFIANILKIILAYLLSKLMGVFGVWLTFIITYILLIIILKTKTNESYIFYAKTTI